jgi:hypothetical protein
MLECFVPFADNRRSTVLSEFTFELGAPRLHSAMRCRLHLHPRPRSGQWSVVGGRWSEVITGLYSHFVLYWSSTVVLRTIPYCTVLYPPLPSSTLPQEPRSTLDRESSTLVAVPAPPCSSEKQATIHYPPGRARPPRPKNNLDNDSTKPPVAQPTTKSF